MVLEAFQRFDGRCAKLVDILYCNHFRESSTARQDFHRFLGNADNDLDPLTGLAQVINVVPVQMDADIVVIGRASFAHGPVVMRFHAILA